MRPSRARSPPTAQISGNVTSPAWRSLGQMGESWLCHGLEIGYPKNWMVNIILILGG